MDASELGGLYRDLLMDHAQSPRGAEHVNDPDLAADGHNPICGDRVHLGLRVEGDRIKKVGVETQGCTICLASGSLLAETIEGKTIAEASALSEAVRSLVKGEPRKGDLGDIEALAGVARFPVRVKCALLPWTTLDVAIADNREPRQGEKR